MSGRENILLALAIRDVRIHIFLPSKIERDRPINLFEAHCRIV